MKIYRSIRNCWVFTLILAVTSLIVSTPAMADIVPTGELLAQEQLESSRNQLVTLLQQEQVADKLTLMGLDVETAKDRVNNLTASELELLSQQIDTLPAGEGALGTIAMVILILILLDIAGVTDIFPGV